MTIAIKICCPRDSHKHLWGDFHFAEALVKSFTAKGFATRIDLRPNWYTSASKGDINLALQGAAQFEPSAGAANFCWIISHPKKAEASHLKRFDHVFVASGPYAKRLNRQHRIDTTALLQCTDPARFNPDAPHTSDSPDVLFVGNTRGRFRPSVKLALEANLDIAVYGSGWKKFDTQNLWHKGRNIPNADLAGFYHHAGVVLNDHWHDMRLLGFVSNRIFDVIASGGLLATDKISGLPAGLEHCTRTYSDAASLTDAVAGLLDIRHEKTEARAAFARDFGQKHSFDARVDRMLEFIGT